MPPSQTVQEMQQRPDVRCARRSARLARQICHEYGLTSAAPQNVLLARPETRGQGRTSADAASLTNPEARCSGAGSPSSSSSSSPEPVANREAASGTFSSWSQVEELVSQLHVSERVKVLKDLNRVLGESAMRAEREIRDIDAREVDLREGDEGSANNDTKDQETIPDKDDPDGESRDTKDEGDEDPLLNFKAEQIPAAEAVRRCQAQVPRLRKRAQKREAARKAAAAARQAVAEETFANGPEGDAFMEDSSSSGENEADPLTRMVEKKLEQIGELPSTADPDLQIALRAQRNEIRSLLQRIKDANQEVQIKNTAICYMEGTYDVEADGEFLKQAMALATSTKDSIYAKEHAAAQKQIQQEKETANVPTEEEMQQQIDESVKLRHQVQLAEEQVQRLRDTYAAKNAKHVAGNRSSASGRIMAPKPATDMVRVSEEHKQLLKQVRELEGKIAEEDENIEQNEEVLNNSSQTLKVLEASRTLLLEHVARAKPDLIQKILPPETKSEVASSEASMAEDNDDEVYLSQEPEEWAADFLSDERWLRSQLQQLELQDDRGEHSGSDQEGPAVKPASLQAITPDHVTAHITADLQQLVQRIRDEANKKKDTVEGSEDESVKKAAAARLRELPHEELRSLIKANNANTRLARQIVDAQGELDSLRQQHGNPEALLADDAGHGSSEESRLAYVIRQQVQELRNLRQYWWKARQEQEAGPSRIVMRRSLAAMGLPEGPMKDQPPSSQQKGILHSVRATMVLPP